MNAIRNPLLEAEPFEEQPQLADSPVVELDDIDRFLAAMHTQQLASPPANAKNTRKSAWYRKSVRKQPPQSLPPTTTVEKMSATATTTTTTTSTTTAFVATSDPHAVDTRHAVDIAASELEQAESWAAALAAANVVPEVLTDLPAWFRKDVELATANPLAFRIKFPIHNPAGQHWYKNFHLIPPPELNPASRPPSLFSTSFPPMASSVYDRSEERLAPSRTPSGSPLPTPSSSQVRIADYGKPRSRKNSQTQDPLDMLDISDPWGNQWHHQSPYDAGFVGSAVSSESDGPFVPRSRVSSITTTQYRRRTVTPSPLSQSTSALHPQVATPAPPAPEPEHVAHIRRKLSKRRKPVFSGIFSSDSKKNDDDRHHFTASDPSTPVDPMAARRTSIIINAPLPPKAMKRHSTAPSSASVPTYSSLAVSQDPVPRERRGSILGRIVRRFSVMKKSSNSPVDAPHPNVPVEIKGQQTSPSKYSILRKPSDAGKRAPAPAPVPQTVETENDPVMRPPEINNAANDQRSSVSSIETTPFSIGKLTIANPDVPSSDDNTPVERESPLPAEKAVDIVPEQKQEPKGVDHTEEAIRFPFPSEPVDIPRKASSRDMSASMASSAPAVVESPSVSQVVAAEVAAPVTFDVPAEPAPVPSNPLPAPVARPYRKSMSSPNRLSSPVLQRVPTFVSPAMVVKPSVTVVHAPAPMVQPSPNASAASTAYVAISNSAIPFPAADEKPLPFPNQPLLASGMGPPKPAFYNDSPLSRSSMLVNPPTPQSYADPYVELPPQGKAPSSKDVAALNASSFSHESYFPSSAKKPESEVVRVAKSNSVSSKQTETFKLVRTPSDRVSSNETILADGEQWAIIEASDAPRRSKTKEKAEKAANKSTRETRREHREQRRQEKASVHAPSDRDHRRALSYERKVSTSRAEHVDRSRMEANPSPRPYRARSLDVPHRNVIPQPVVYAYQDPKLVHRRSEERQRDGYYQSSHAGGKRHSSSRPGYVSSQGPAMVERLPTHVGRPTSELPSADELHALKAREAWDLDRMWKGRSMYYGVPETIATPPSKAMSDSSRGAPGTSPRSATHGSNHTGYVLQNPVLPHATPAHVFYANMPALPPQIIYAPYPHPVPVHQPTAHYAYTGEHRTLPHSFALAVKDAHKQPAVPSSASAASSARPANNPLPAPPKQSPYQPSSIPLLSSDPGNGSPSEYWTNYTSVTTSH